MLASSAYALAPVSTAEKMLYIGTVSTADDLAQRQVDKYPYLVLAGWVPSQPNHPLGQWACDQGYKRIVAIAPDYAFGYEQVGGFQKGFEDCGGKIVQKIWVPLGTKDFGPYIPTIKSDADAMFTVMVGPMSLQFPKQLRAAGNKLPIVGGGTSYDEFALPFMGDEVIGDVSALQYSAALQTPQNEKFVKDYRARYGKVPSYYSEVNYAAAKWIDLTLAKPTASTRDRPNSSKRWRRSSSMHHAGRSSLTRRPSRLSRTSTSRRSRRRRCSATTRTSSGIR